MDLTSYGASPYGEGSPKRGDQNQSKVAAALRGILQQEEPGSVLDAATAGNKELNAGFNLASILSDAVPAKGAMGLAGTFIGKNAKTWNTKAALEASKLLKAGHDPEMVRKLTGTSLFPDGQLRQEITDHDAVLTRMLMPDAKADVLGKQLIHPELAAAYPEIMSGTKARIRGSSAVSGEYQGGKIKVDADNLSNAKSVLLHETQHNVQDLEGFGRGGSPEEFLQDAQWAAKARGKDDTWAQRKAYQDYMRLAGEAEARLTQRRRALTPEERRQTPLDWDVPPDMQRVLGTLRQGEATAAKATVWHGSPYEFDAFDSSKIGTGEGAQAYGHGLYLAESPAVGKQYMKDISTSFNAREVFPLKNLKDTLVAKLEKDKEVYRGKTYLSPQEKQDIFKQIKAIDLELSNVTAKFNPTLYEIDLPDEHIAKMPDLDLPIEQAPQAMQDYYRRVGAYKPGQPLLDHMAIDKSAATELATAGIPGVRYLDEVSRNAGKGTSNFVVFPGNEHVLTIKSRNGKVLDKLRQKP